LGAGHPDPLATSEHLCSLSSQGLTGDAGRRADVVFVSAEDWRAIHETLHLHPVLGLRVSIIEGMETPAEDCDEQSGW
jgi:hypothetical protein